MNITPRLYVSISIIGKQQPSTISSQCDYPAACNAMETLLIHKSHLSGGLFHKLIDDLKQNNVKVKLYKPLTILNPFRIFVEPGKMVNYEFDPITIILS